MHPAIRWFSLKRILHLLLAVRSGKETLPHSEQRGERENMFLSKHLEMVTNESNVT